MIDMTDMLNVFQNHRGDAIVISGRASKNWVNISTYEKRDVPLGDPAMGGHASFAFGLALANPDKKIVLFDSEGDVLMNMGVLTTIAEVAPPNFYHFLLDNECYATTGGQPVPNAQNVAYDVIASGSGYPSAHSFDNLEDFTNNVEEILSNPGPVMVALKINPEIENEPIGRTRRWQTRTRDQVIEDLQEQLGV